MPVAKQPFGVFLSLFPPSSNSYLLPCSLLLCLLSSTLLSPLTSIYSLPSSSYYPSLLLLPLSFPYHTFLHLPPPTTLLTTPSSSPHFFPCLPPPTTPPYHPFFLTSPLSLPSSSYHPSLPPLLPHLTSFLAFLLLPPLLTTPSSSPHLFPCLPPPTTPLLSLPPLPPPTTSPYHPSSSPHLLSFAILLRPRSRCEVCGLASFQRIGCVWEQGQPAASEALGPQGRTECLHAVRG